MKFNSAAVVFCLSLGAADGKDLPALFISDYLFTNPGAAMFIPADLNGLGYVLHHNNESNGSGDSNAKINMPDY